MGFYHSKQLYACNIFVLFVAYPLPVKTGINKRACVLFFGTFWHLRNTFLYTVKLCACVMSNGTGWASWSYCVPITCFCLLVNTLLLWPCVFWFWPTYCPVMSRIVLLVILRNGSFWFSLVLFSTSNNNGMS